MNNNNNNNKRLIKLSAGLTKIVGLQIFLRPFFMLTLFMLNFTVQRHQNIEIFKIFVILTSKPLYTMLLI